MYRLSNHGFYRLSNHGFFVRKDDNKLNEIASKWYPLSIRAGILVRWITLAGEGFISYTPEQVQLTIAEAKAIWEELNSLKQEFRKIRLGPKITPEDVMSAPEKYKFYSGLDVLKLYTSDVEIENALIP